jgi:hypothetical protein
MAATVVRIPLMAVKTSGRGSLAMTVTIRRPRAAVLGRELVRFEVIFNRTGEGVLD